jgi:outer membrane protein assembly factor BamB
MVPPELGTGWPVAQGDIAGTRAGRSSIDSSNVGGLEVAWTFDLVGSGIYGSITSNPIIVGDTVYIQDMQSNVFALDRMTGSVKWTAVFNVGSSGPNGVTAGYGLVYAPLGDTRELVALDARGNVVWRRQVGKPGEGIDMAPVAYNGLVYVSTVPGVSTDYFYGPDLRGVLYALDASNGDVAWSFDTTNGGWGQGSTGGGLWYPPSFDSSGNAYFGTGNPGPYPLTPDCPNGSCRPGDNLYTDSMVSLDPTGKLRWFYQDRKHDLLDLDFQNTPILVDGLAIGSGKTGNVVAADQATGAVQWRRPVCLPKIDELVELPAEPIEILPGLFGAVVTGIAYADGSLYVACVNVPQYESATGPGENNGAFAAGKSELVAIDVHGKVRWQHPVNTVLLGGTTVANDVVFASGLDGFIRALSTVDGTELWNHESRSGYNAPPAIAGDMMFAPAGFLKFPQGGGPPIGAAPDGSSAPVAQLTAFVVPK